MEPHTLSASNPPHTLNQASICFIWMLDTVLPWQRSVQTIGQKFRKHPWNVVLLLCQVLCCCCFHIKLKRILKGKWEIMFLQWTRWASWKYSFNLIEIWSFQTVQIKSNQLCPESATIILEKTPSLLTEDSPPSSTVCLPVCVRRWTVPVLHCTFKGEVERGLHEGLPSVTLLICATRRRVEKGIGVMVTLQEHE